VSTSDMCDVSTVLVVVLWEHLAAGVAASRHHVSDGFLKGDRRVC
jgi:hypothetical protein